MPSLRPNLTYANVMSTVAVFIVLGGTGLAAAKLPKNSVGRAQIRANAIDSSRVRNGSLLAADFKLGQIPPGPRGSQGPQGPQGVPGPLAQTVPSGVTIRGTWGFRTHIAAGQTFGIAVSFPVTAPAEPTPEVVPAGVVTTHCTGTGADPTAAPGHLCVYQRFSQNIAQGATRITDVAGTANRATRYGFGVEDTAAGSSGMGTVIDGGTWAYTAP